MAERLGVSVPGLYHYVSGREDLIRLAAGQSALRMTMPVDHGQHWAVWLYQWADYNRRAFSHDPELLKHFIDGAVGPELTAPAIDRAIGPCMAQGFTARQALEAYDLVCECALGSAIAAIRHERSRREGNPFDLEVRTLIARGEQLPNLERLLAEGGQGGQDGQDGQDTAGPAAPEAELARFQRQIITVLAGVAALRGGALGPDPAPAARARGSCHLTGRGRRGSRLTPSPRWCRQGSINWYMLYKIIRSRAAGNGAPGGHRG